MNCFVTGASGFIGANLVHELVARKHQVRALLRPGSDLRGLRGAEFERVEGDLSDGAKLKEAMRGCDWCFHVAASYHLWLRDYRPMYAANVEGTRNVIEAAAAAGCLRIVYTSTVGCIGLPEPIEGRIIPSDEATPVSEGADEESLQALEMAGGTGGHPAGARRSAGHHRQPERAGRPARCEADPDRPGHRGFPEPQDAGIPRYGAELGPRAGRGHRPHPGGGERAHRRTLHPGQRGGELDDEAGVCRFGGSSPASARRDSGFPIRLALGAAYADEALSLFTRQPPKAPLAGVRMARHKMYFNPAKAIRELGLPQTPPRQALADAAEWFRQNGYVK